MPSNATHMGSHPEVAPCVRETRPLCGCRQSDPAARLLYKQLLTMADDMMNKGMLGRAADFYRYAFSAGPMKS